jgi:multiple sugar transport system substrate-binding protein
MGEQQQQQSRRQFLATSGLTGAALLLGACGGSSSSGTSSGGGDAGGPVKGSASFLTWASDAELAAFKAAIKDFEQQNRGAKIDLRPVPFEQVKSNVDANLEAGKAPDLFRVTYQDLGFYSSQQALLDLSPHLPSGFESAIVPGVWQAVQYQGKPYAVPAHTDVSALVYNKAMLAKAGIKSVPDSVDNAWDWNEFMDAARKVRDANPGKYGFAMNWTLAGAYRWLNWLWQSGGTLLSQDLKQPALDSPEARRTLSLFQTWFKEELVPRNATPKGPYPDEVFPSQTIGMCFAGDFLVPALEDTVKKFEWGVMPLPRDKEAATDLGGTAIVVTSQSKNQAVAAKFATFMGSRKQMQRFCEATGTLPVRQDLVDAKLQFNIRPDVMPIYQEQVKTLPGDLVKSVTLPKFTQINNAFTDQLEQLVRGQSVDDTISNLNSALQQQLS